jgi:glycosyltransferase involved in cell wall biosynthesis
VNILTLTPFFPTTRDGAQGCFVAEPLNGLSTIGVEGNVLFAQPFYRPAEQPLTSVMPAELVRYMSVPGGWGLSSAGAFLFAAALKRVRELHARQRIDAIHAHGPLPCGHAAMLLGHELNISYVVSVHGLDAYSTNQVRGIPGLWCRRVSQRVFRFAKSAICVSRHVADEVLAGGAGFRTSVVYNGVDPDLFSPGDEPASTRLSILNIGNLIPIKGHETMVRAFAGVASQFPDLHLDIVGDGPEHRRLTNLARELNVGDRVHFLGRQSRQDVAQLLRHCTIFVLPSKYEGLGCVYLEAMSSAKVAIGCRGQGIEEIIRHGQNGWLIHPDNVQELSTGLSMLLSDGALRNRIGHQARKTVLQGLTLVHQAIQLRKVYEEACA